MMPIDFYKATVIAVDPGLRGCGVAVFKRGILHHAKYVRNKDEHERGPVSHMQMAEAVGHAIQDCSIGVRESVHVVIEFPQIYGGPAKVDLNDLLDIAGVASAVLSHVATLFLISDANCRFTLPYGWKGNINKAIMTNRISASLTDAERGVIVSVGAKDHNTIDAVGIGLWQLGRLNKKAYAS